jgi:hypothetical protein
MMPAPFIATADTYPRRMRSISTGDRPVLITWAPSPQTMPASARRASRIAAATAATSRAPSMRGSDANQSAKLPPGACGRAKSSARTLLRREARGYVRTADKSNSS